MDYQPNNDNAHDHTYPVTTEELSYFDIDPFPNRITRRLAALEASLFQTDTTLQRCMSELEATVEALRQRLAHTDAIVHAYINHNEAG